MAALLTKSGSGRNIAVLLVLCFLFASCGVGRKSGLRPSDSNLVVREHKKPEKHNGDPGFNVDSHMGERIVKSARKWLGTPYRYGGADRKGTDCSGMTMSLYKEVAGISIPRNSGKQYEYCVSIGHEDLQPGDLVFFSSKAGGSTVGHVGLYIGDRKMIHASGSKGVMESSLDERYWITHYYGSGRVSAMTCAVTGRKPSRNGKRQRKDKPVAVPDYSPAKASDIQQQAAGVLVPPELPADCTPELDLPLPEEELNPVQNNDTDEKISSDSEAVQTSDKEADDKTEQSEIEDEINELVKNAFGN